MKIPGTAYPDLLVYLGIPATGSDQVLPEIEGLVGALPLLAEPSLLGAEPIGPVDAERLRPEAGERLRAALASRGATRARVVLPVRRQDRLMEYAHLDEVRRGSAVPFADQFPRPRNPSLDWGDLARRLSEVPGVEQVVVTPLEWITDPLQAFIAAAGVLGPWEAPTPPAPPTYSARGIRVARALNEHLVDDAERELVREFVTAHFPGPPEGNQFLSAATRARVLAAYAEVNRRLFRDWLPGLPEDAWLDDDRTARLKEPP